MSEGESTIHFGPGGPAKTLASVGPDGRAVSVDAEAIEYDPNARLLRAVLRIGRLRPSGRLVSEIAKAAGAVARAKCGGGPDVGEAVEQEVRRRILELVPVGEQAIARVNDDSEWEDRP